MNVVGSAAYDAIIIGDTCQAEAVHEDFVLVNDV